MKIITPVELTMKFYNIQVNKIQTEFVPSSEVLKNLL